ncbi:acetylserotonin O-methyltransferase 2 isoform X2 [Polypterus senegalus]|uniref:acetylserotonin O-methyltransferase 2 isoform X2 n=1 Tax=Polypterus senegalus TaxID=55291 RepID=UPI001962C5EE|nr:acetylserotonin O-methyltransferase 2 isoform X2 [Polypterus senegalus]
MAEQLSQSEQDYPFKLLEYINGFKISKVIFTASQLGVFDLMLQCQKALSAECIAKELHTSQNGLERLLDALVGIDILDVEIINGKAFYSSTDVSDLYLAKASPKSLSNMILYQSQNIYPLWNFLPDAVRCEEELLKFMGMMHSTWVFAAHDVVTAIDLSPFKTVVNLGGCTGTLAREVCLVYPHCSVTVFDIPEVVKMAKKHFCGIDDCITFKEGDFFNGELPEANLYILAGIIHGWEEEKCLQLLHKIYAQSKPGGGVLIVESMLNENRRGPIFSQLLSLNMLLQMEGKERPPSEFFKLLTTAGFKDIQVQRTGKCYDVVLGIK